MSNTIPLHPHDIPDHHNPVAVYRDDTGNENGTLLCIFPTFRAAVSVVCKQSNRWPANLVWDTADRPLILY